MLRVLAELADLVLPTCCAGCRAPGPAVCPGCRAVLAGPARAAPPRPSPAGLALPFAVAAYDGVVRQLLLTHKERGGHHLLGPLADALATAVTAAAVHAPTGGPLVLVPVPSTRAARRARGVDHVLRLARAAARRVGEPAQVVPALEHARAVADSAGLDSAARAANLAHALRARPATLPRLAGRRVVVVDDLVTTGATLAEAARALRAGGAAVTASAVVAATQRRATPRCPPALVGPSGEV